MKICVGNDLVDHKQIVHDEAICPLCEVLELLDELERSLDKVSAERDEYQSRAHDAEEQLVDRADSRRG